MPRRQYIDLALLNHLMSRGPREPAEVGVGDEEYKTFQYLLY